MSGKSVCYNVQVGVVIATDRPEKKKSEIEIYLKVICIFLVSLYILICRFQS